MRVAGIFNERGPPADEEGPIDQGPAFVAVQYTGSPQGPNGSAGLPSVPENGVAGRDPSTRSLRSLARDDMKKGC